MLPPYWRSRFFNHLIGMALIGPCLISYSRAQVTQNPLETPRNTEYPGIIQTFEKIIQIDNTKFQNKFEALLKNGKTLQDPSKINILDLDPDFLNSIILHSNPGYVRLASTNKCRFYDTILTDLLRSVEGKIKNVLVTYINKDGEKESGIISRKEFLNSVVTKECPETTSLINQFQIKQLDQTLKSTIFEIPTGKEHCQSIHLGWLNNPKTPYFCQIHDYINEAQDGTSDSKDLQQRQAIAKILDKKLNLIQKDYIENICTNLDNENLFCDEFLSVSFWSKIAGGYESKIFSDNICKKVSGNLSPSDQAVKQCLARLKKENDLCLYGAGSNSSLSPAMECDILSTALNYSSLRSDYHDCPGNSDQMAATNLGRILLNITKEPIEKFSGACSVISAAETLKFNQKFNNEEVWNLEACYDDRINEKEVCSKTFFGQYGKNPFSFTHVVANILKNVRGADPNLSCSMIDSQNYNSLLLQYKSGCYIIYDRNNCHITQCKHKIIFNDRPIDLIRIKNRLSIEYFPLSVKMEQFSQHFLLTRDFKQTARSLQNLTAVKAHFKKNKKSLLYGVGCAEDILPSFFKTRSLNQCSPLPFIIDGIISEGNSYAFVTRTAADSLQAPRLVSWSNIYSGVKSYQLSHPLKTWTLYGLD